MDKRDLLELKNMVIEEKDYRGLLGLFVWGGYFVLAGIAVVRGDIAMFKDITVALAPVFTAITGFYFRGKAEKEK